MSDSLPDNPRNEQIIATAEALLSKRCGGHQRVASATELDGSGMARVFRAKLAPSPFLHERSVVIKYIPVTDDELDDAALVREVVAYQFTTSLSEDVRPGPVLIAHDVAGRMLVISDSGDGDTFAELLNQGDGEQRIQILRNLGEALGLMHTATAGRDHDFEVLRRLMQKKHPQAAEINRFRAASHSFAIRSGLTMLIDAGIDVPRSVHDLGEEAAKMMRGGYRAFTPCDLSPDNIIVAHRTHFLDYEWADFRDVYFDLACVVAGFPQFLSAKPIADEEVDVFLDAWLREVEGTWPSITDNDALQLRLSTAILGLLLGEICAMHYGTPHNMVHATALAADQEILTRYEEAITPVEQLLTPRFRLPQNPEPISHEVAMMRRDLFETSEALARYAARGVDNRLAVLAHFARDLAQRFGGQDSSR